MVEKIPILFPSGPIHPIQPLSIQKTISPTLHMLLCHPVLAYLLHPVVLSFRRLLHPVMLLDTALVGQ